MGLPDPKIDPKEICLEDFSMPAYHRRVLLAGIGWYYWLVLAGITGWYYLLLLAGIIG